MNATIVRRPNPWPIAIVCYFIVFIACVAGFITWAVKQNMDLVRKDYYEEEIRFQQQMEKVRRTQPLQATIQVAYNTANSVLEIRLPMAHMEEGFAGRVHLYRPSDASRDLDLPLARTADGIQRIGTSQLLAGLWKVRLNWTAKDQDYFSERSVIVE
jgi:nitrogen fixation protein FixH